MKNLVALLNKEVANLGVLYTKLHSYHWFITGRRFYQLHELFEKFYDEVTEHFDAVAERLLMLNERPVATLKEFLALASIEEATGKETEEEMIRGVIRDFETLNVELTEGIRLAQDVSDEVTVDLLIGITASLQKHVWMLKSLLK